MGEHGGIPEDRAPVDVRLLRPQDLVDLRLEAPGCTLEPTADGAELVAGPDASLVLHFPPQHLGEEVLQSAAPPPGAPASWPASRHVVAGPSRLVYAVPEGTRIPYALADVLAAVRDLPLRVAAGATPAGEALDGDAEPPTPLETAIEAPYRLVVSPSVRGAFRHSSTPAGPAERAELWRTHLTGRRDDGSLHDEDDEERIVRALAARDEQPPPGFVQPLTAANRQALVHQTSGGDAANAATPLLVDHLALSSLGAWFAWHQSWQRPAGIEGYRHEAAMGRDTYVRVAYPGFFFPFGHRCTLVKLTERSVRHRDAPVAHLWQRWFLIVREPTRRYPGEQRDNPFAEVTLSPLVTPDLDPPADDGQPFVPRRSGAPFPFTLTTVDRGGGTRSWAAPLVFVQADAPRGRAVVLHPELAAPRYLPVRQIPGRGQTLAVAPSVDAGDTSVEVTHLVFDGEVDTAAVTSRPFLTSARAVLPALRHLAPQSPAVDLVFAQPYLAHGLPARAPGGGQLPGAANPGELLLALASPALPVSFSTGSERTGGFVAPNLSVRGLSRALGAVGVDGSGPTPFDTGRFDPATFLSGALPRLFGLFSLLDLLDAGGLDEAPAFVSDALDAVSTVLREGQRLQAALDDAGVRLDAEVAGAAHAGAAAVAEHARDQLAARVESLRTRLAALVAAVQALPADPGAVGDAATALAPELELLLTAIGVPGVPAAVRSALTKPVQALRVVTDVADQAVELTRLLEGAAAGQVTARLQWRPAIHAWGLGTAAPGIFKPLDPHGLHLDVEVRASATAPPVVDVVAELVDFELNLIGDRDAGLVQLAFRRIGFHAGSVGKPEVDVVFGGLKFLGPLAFVDRLRELIPFDGFSDPPFVDVSPDGVRAGFDLTLPNVAVGVFSLENIALGADARVPFLGDAMTVGFAFCSKDAPFRLTVMAVGGGGWLALRASPKGLVLLELGLEAAASLSVDLGVASGAVSISVGVYLRLEADTGLLTAYFRIRGEVDVLGLISASITLELSLTYHFETGKLIGRASLVVEVEVLFFSTSVEITVERKLAGSKGDPTLFQILPPDDDGANADWALYCDAFAPVPS